MLDLLIPDLTLSRIPVGSHGAVWDLCVLLYRNAASMDRRKVSVMLERGEFGQPLAERLPLLIIFHNTIQDRLTEGGEGAVLTSIKQLGDLFRFFAWADKNHLALTLETVRNVYFVWVENLVHRYRIKKDLKHGAAYGYARLVGTLVAVAIGVQHPEPGRVMLAHTRMRPPRRAKRVLGAREHKQRLDDTFAFGHLMADLCNGLSVEAVRGPLPVIILRRNGSNVVLKGFLNASLDPLSLRKKAARERALRSRAPLAVSMSAIEARPALINLRIEAEMLIFVAQTGMNLSQAAKLRREQYRWQTDGDDLQAFRVYKGRRGGEAVFRCFRAYRANLNRYLIWLESLGLHDGDDRMFPFICHGGVIPPAQRLPLFHATKRVCGELGMAHFKPRALRKTRVNWLLRFSRDANITAEMAAHAKETLLRDYEEPHHQSAAAEIVRYHQKTDPTCTPPGPGICVDPSRRPEMVPGSPQEAPEPDCISPEGCLFCVYHRDVMSAEYCWKLASHARLKNLEATMYRPPKSQDAHPAHAVIDRIEAKLHAIEVSSKVRAHWVKDARDDVRAGHYHPIWHGRIRLLETLDDRA